MAVALELEQGLAGPWHERSVLFDALPVARVEPEDDAVQIDRYSHGAPFVLQPGPLNWRAALVGRFWNSELPQAQERPFSRISACQSVRVTMASVTLPHVLHSKT
jgi:hypothetical protein